MRSIVRSMREWMPSVRHRAVRRDVVEERVDLLGAPRRADVKDQPNTSCCSSRARMLEFDQGEACISPGGQRRAIPAEAQPAACSILAIQSSRLFLASASIARPDASKHLAGIADFQLADRADQHVEHVGLGDILLQRSSRNAEQRWPVERKAEVITSSITCSGSAVASTIMVVRRCPQ